MAVWLRRKYENEYFFLFNFRFDVHTKFGPEARKSPLHGPGW